MKESLEVWMLRHGETLAQTGAEYSLDPGLSSKGILQARAAGELLRNTHFDLILLSPLKRCLETYCHAQNTGLRGEELFYDTRIVENALPDTYTSLLPYDFFPGPEEDTHNAWNLSSEKRVVALRGDFAQMFEKNVRRLLLISHGAFLNDFLSSYVTHESNTRNQGFCFRMDNGAISMLNHAFGDAAYSMLVFWNYIPGYDHFSGSFYHV